MNTPESNTDVLVPNEYLELLKSAGNKSENATEEGKRKEAKTALLQAHMDLIKWTINKVASKQRTANRQVRIGIEEFSELLNSAAAQIYQDISEIEQQAKQNGFKISTGIAARVANQIIDKIRKATAAKRTAEFAPSDELDHQFSVTDPLATLKPLMLKECLKKLRFLIDGDEVLNETERNVVFAMLYAAETDQFITVSQVANVLEIPVTTARSAFHSAREKLKMHLQNPYDDE